jgi:hypothetical protein
MQGIDPVREFHTEAEEAWWWLMDSKNRNDDAEVPPRPLLSAFAASARAALNVAELVLALDRGLLLDSTALGHEALLPQEEDIIDSWNADVALWADDALSRPGLWSEEEEYAARLSYWNWWLTTAVPTAWETAIRG